MNDAHVFRHQHCVRLQFRRDARLFGTLAPWGVVLSLAAGAVLMSLSTTISAINLQLLRRVAYR